MKYLFAALALAVPAAIFAGPFEDLDAFCRATNERFGAYVAEEFCSCLQLELKKVLTEEELKAYFSRPAGSPEDVAIDRKGREIGKFCREKVEKSLQAI